MLSLSKARIPKALAPAIAMALIGGLAYGAAQQGGRDGLTACLSNVKQVNLGIMMYVQDYDETFPPMTTAAHLQNRVFPYVKNRNTFRCPVTGADYLGNPALNYQPLAALKSPADTILLRDAKPHTDVGDKPVWITGYADGHAKAVMTEPMLGKPAPMPKPLPRSAVVKMQLRELRQARQRIDQQIRALEREERRLRR